MSRRAQNGGFTLMEMLVVTAIIGLVTAMAVLSLRVLGQADTARDDARRLARHLAMARDLAELEQRSIGLRIDTQGYTFAGFSQRRNLWYALEERSLPVVRWSSDVEVLLLLEGRAVTLEPQDDPQPQLGVEADGDYTAFELQFRSRGDELPWILRPRAEGDLELLEPGS